MSSDYNHKKYYSAEDIRNYWSGKMSRQEMHNLERASLDDPFLADALEGYGTIDSRTAQADIEWLEQQLQEKKNKSVIVPFFKHNWFRIAAMLLIVAGLLTLSYFVFTPKNNVNNIAGIKSQTREKENQPAPNSINKNEEVAVNQPTIKKPGTNSITPVIRENEQNSIKHNSEPVKDITPDNTKSTDDVFRKRVSGIEVTSAESAKVVQNETVKIDEMALKPPAPAASVAVHYNDSIQKNTIANSEAKKMVKAENSLDNAIFGKVTGLKDEPIQGAVVTSQDFNYTTITDKNGYFRLNVPDTFSTGNVALNNKIENKIRLQENKNELVVTGYGARKKANVAAAVGKVENSNAFPKDGWANFNDYITKNKRPIETVKGIVLLNFVINSNGRPANITVEKSLSKAADSEAIRLVKEGPDWLPGTSDNKIQLTVTF